eukprot:g3179.t1
MGNRASVTRDADNTSAVRSFCKDLITATEVGKNEAMEALLGDISTSISQNTVDFLRDMVKVLHEDRRSKASPSSLSKEGNKEEEFNVYDETFATLVTKHCLHSKNRMVRLQTLKMYIALTSPLPKCYQSYSPSEKNVLERSREALLCELRIIFGGELTFSRLFRFFTCEGDGHNISSKYHVVRIEGDRAVPIKRVQLRKNVWMSKKEDRLLAFEAVRSLAWHCAQNQSAARSTGMIQTLSTFLEKSSDKETRLASLRALESILCEFNLPILAKDRIVFVLLRSLAREIGPNPTQRAAPDKSPSSKTGDECMLVAQNIIARFAMYPVLGRILGNCVIMWHQESHNLGISVLLAILSFRLKIPRATCDSKSFRITQLKKQIDIAGATMSVRDCEAVVGIAAAVCGSLRDEVQVERLFDVLNRRILPIARTWHPRSNVKFGEVDRAESSAVSVSGNRILLIAFRVLRVSQRKEANRSKAVAALWIASAILHVHHRYEKLAENRLRKSFRSGECVGIRRMLKSHRKTGRVLSMNKNGKDCNVKEDVSGSVRKTNSKFLESRLSDILLNTPPDQTVGVNSISEFFALIPEMVRQTEGFSYVHIDDQDIEECADEYDALVAISEALLEVARNFAFETPDETLTQKRSKKASDFLSFKTSYLQILDALVDVTEKRDEGIYVRRNFLVQRNVVRSVAMLSLRGGGRDSWASRICRDADTPNLLKLLVRCARRASMRWMAELRKEGLSKMAFSDEDRHQDLMKSNSDSRFACCSSGSDSASLEYTDGSHYIGDPSNVRSLDGLCFVTIANCSTALGNIPRIKSKAFKLLNVFDSLPVTSFPDKLFRKSQDAVSMEPRYSALYTGVETWCGKPDSESKIEIKERVQKVVDRVLNGDCHGILWQLAYLSNTNDAKSKLSSCITNSLRTLRMAKHICAHESLSSEWGEGPLKSLDITLSGIFKGKNRGVPGGTKTKEMLGAASLIAGGVGFREIQHAIMKRERRGRKNESRKTFLDPCSNGGAEALIAAVKRDDIVLLDNLLNQKFVNPTARRSKDGLTPVHVAACEGRLLSLEVLLQQVGKDPDVGCYPLPPCNNGHFPKYMLISYLLNVKTSAPSAFHVNSATKMYSCLEMLCQFSKTFSVGRRGPSSYRMDETRRIIVSSMLSLAVGYCAAKADTFMGYDVMRGTKTRSDEETKLVQRGLKLSLGTALSVARCNIAGATCRSRIVRLVEATTRFPTFNGRNMVVWIARRDSLSARKRRFSLASSWLNNANALNRTLLPVESKVGSAANSIVLRLVALDRDRSDFDNRDILMRIERDFTVGDVRNAIARFFSPEDDAGIYRVDLVIRGKVLRARDGRRKRKKSSSEGDTPDDQIPFRHDTVVSYNIRGKGSSMSRAFWDVKSETAANDKNRRTRARKITANDLSMALLAKRRFTIQNGSISGDSSRRVSTASKKKESTDGDGRVETKDAVSITRSNVRLKKPFRPTSCKFWLLTSRVRITFGKRNRHFPTAWSIAEVESCESSADRWRLVFVECTNQNGARIFAFGFARSDKIVWDSDAQRAWKNMAADATQQRRQDFVKYFPWIQRVYVVSKDEKSKVKLDFCFSASQNMRASGSNERHYMHCSVGQYVALPTKDPHFPTSDFVFRGFRAFDELDLLRSYEPSKEKNSGVVRDFVVLERDDVHTNVRYFNSNGDRGSYVVSQHRQPEATQVFVDEVRVWDGAGLSLDLPGGVDLSPSYRRGILSAYDLNETRSYSADSISSALKRLHVFDAQEHAVYHGAIPVLLHALKTSTDDETSSCALEALRNISTPLAHDGEIGALAHSVLARANTTKNALVAGEE